MKSQDKVNAVKRMQKYIDDHIKERVTLYALAKEAGYSPWHSARIFKDCIGKTPFDYIKTMRLSYAANRLRKGDEKIIDVAFDFVFGSHETFTRAFSRQFGMTPQFYKKNKPELKLFLPGYIHNYYYRKLQKGEVNMSKKNKINTVFIQVVERPSRKLILKRGINATHYFGYCEEVGCEVWNTLSGIKEALYEPIGMWLPDNLKKPGTSTYVQGVEVPIDYSGKFPEGFELIELPPCKMMVFQGQPYDDEKFEDAISEIWEVINDFNPELYGFFWAVEDGPRFQLEPMGYRGYIEARPVRPISK
ncbi:MAG: AraC family transcriptional regulator [Actinobacteria bacterium]|nr:AraC family transcriptional regulator [Actinomycetota bacterium]